MTVSVFRVDPPPPPFKYITLSETQEINLTARASTFPYFLITWFMMFLFYFKGALISVCADDSLHLWNLRHRKPAIVHSLHFNYKRDRYKTVNSKN